METHAEPEVPSPSARAAFAGLVAGALLLLPACGGADPAPDGRSANGGSGATADGAGGAGGAATKRDPCSVLPTDAVARILQGAHPDEGTVTVTTQSVGDGTGGTCTYAWSGAVTFSKTFSVSTLDASALDASVGDAERTEIPGVGDEAFEASDTYYARVGDRALHLVNLQEDRATTTAVLKAAAEEL